MHSINDNVLEVVEKDKKLTRFNVKVKVVPQPVVPGSDNKSLLAQANTALSNQDDKTKKIIRRYQTLPTPLVRDNVHKWRTGRLDRVLDGNFDVMGR